MHLSIISRAIQFFQWTLTERKLIVRPQKGKSQLKMESCNFRFIFLHVACATQINPLFIVFPSHFYLIIIKTQWYRKLQDPKYAWPSWMASHVRQKLESLNWMLVSISHAYIGNSRITDIHVCHWTTKTVLQAVSYIKWCLGEGGLEERSCSVDQDPTGRLAAPRGHGHCRPIYPKRGWPSADQVKREMDGVCWALWGPLIQGWFRSRWLNRGGRFGAKVLSLKVGWIP